MLRNVPKNVDQDTLLEMLRERGLETKGENGVNFFYAPVDFKTNQSVGYAFLNFTTHAGARKFIEEFQNVSLVTSCQCDVSWARVQGYDANLKHYQDSPVMELEHKFRPRLFDWTSGNEIDFPRSNREVHAKCIHAGRRLRLLQARRNFSSAVYPSR